MGIATLAALGLVACTSSNSTEKPGQATTGHSSEALADDTRLADSQNWTLFGYDIVEGSAYATNTIKFTASDGELQITVVDETKGQSS